MRLAIATCANLPEWEVDDRPLHEAFAHRGVAFQLAVWNDPSVDWAAFDGCLVRTTWDYQEHRDQFVQWAQRTAAACHLLNPAPIIRWNTHKSYLRDLEARGVPVLPTQWCATGVRTDLRQVMRDRGWTRGFLKPAVGATARETMRFTCSDEDLATAQAHLDRLSAAEDMLLQPYQTSVEETGELSAIFIGGRLTHAVAKVPPPGDYRVQDDFGGRDEPAELTDEASRLAHRIMEVVDPALAYGRLDFLADDAGELHLTELELVEPSLFFRHGPHAAEALADVVIERVRGG